MQNYQHPTNLGDVPVRLIQLCSQIGSALMAVAALLAVALPAAAETAEARPAVSEKADALVEGAIKTNELGVAVLVAQNGKILFEKCYGLADREHHVPVIPQTIFRIGSDTKQFTASAILKLQEEEKLSVSDKLSKYIPDFPRGDEVTLYQLLTHTSGIHDYMRDLEPWGHMTNATTTKAVITQIKNYPYDFDPGTKWDYDNSGYLLLGYIVEKVSGHGYGDFLREKFFQPLGMTNTGVYRAHVGLPHKALGYGPGKNGFERAEEWDASWCGGAGGLCSTVEDLYRWNEDIFNGRVLDAASLKAAFTPVKGSQGQEGFDAGYGFGWYVGQYRGLREISHDGGVPGFTSTLLRLPDEKFTVAILANAQLPHVASLLWARQLVTIFLADKLAPLPTVNTNVSPQSYEALTGRFALERLGAILTISRRGTHLFAQTAGWIEQEIFPKSDTEFFVKGVDVQITFEKDSSGKAVKLILHRYGIDRAASRAREIAEAKVDPAVYDSVIGKYDSGHTVLTVTREGNHLFAQFSGESKCEIFPKSETEYFWKVADVQITFVKNASGKVTKAIHHQGGQNIDAQKIQ